ncbi:MAG: hypothetical protein ACR2QU_11095 [Gammaproteobacteria bacterium]
MRALIVAMAVLVSACAEEAPIQVSLDVGAHAVTFDAPEAWQHFGDEKEHLFKKEIAQIFLTDAGPVTVQGFKQEVERARTVFREVGIEQANDILNAIRWRSSFPSIDRWETFSTSLTQARGLWDRREHYDPFAVESAYTELLVQLETLPDRDIDTLAVEVLADIEPLDRRTIRNQSPMLVDGRSALLIETWDRLNHIQPMRYIFILDEGRFLIVRSGLGQFSEIEPAFDAIAASLTLQ